MRRAYRDYRCFLVPLYAFIAARTPHEANQLAKMRPGESFLFRGSLEPVQPAAEAGAELVH